MMIKPIFPIPAGAAPFYLQKIKSEVIVQVELELIVYWLEQQGESPNEWPKVVKGLEGASLWP